MNQQYLEELNEVQRKAVTHLDGPVLVVAGPGSGKTRVLTYRIAHIINSGVPPRQILALTFTNKAAREMKERIGKVVGSKALNVWAGTFHAIFARILRIEADKIGYPKDFTIYDTDDTKSVLKSIIKELNLNDNYNVNGMRSRISAAKSNLITPKAYEANVELRKQDDSGKRPLMYKVYAAYESKCKRSGAMDFDDLLYRFYELLYRNPDQVLEKYQARFSHVLVDEFQDTNHLQYEILKKLVTYPQSPNNICAVGDDAQSIYAFRGATIQNILDFEEQYKKHGIAVYKLEQNYRSTDPIVQAANSVISNNRNQIPKKIWSNKGAGRKINLIETQTDGEEGKRVIESIIEQKSRQHFQNKDFAILYRTNAQSRIFEEHLNNERIPYRIYGGISFYNRKEVKDLIGYFRLAVNPDDDEALKRVINYPKRAIGKTTVDKVIAVANANGLTLWKTLILLIREGKAKKNIQDFVKMIDEFQRQVTEKNAFDLALMIARKSGILDLFRKDDSEEGKKRFENIDALLNGVQAFVEDNTLIETEGEGDKSLATYLQNVALLTSLDEDEDDDDRVSLMSIHAAKGLEFKSVFVTGLEEKLFPSFMALESQSIEGENEERRLFYVAITRAEIELSLSYAKRRYRHGKIVFTEPSRFLAEIPQDQLLNQSLSVQKQARQFNPVSGVKGNFARRGTTARMMKPVVDPSTFKPSPSHQIESGLKVLHLKFGAGKVVTVDGGANNRIATILFDQNPDEEKRIMLKYAKLQILDD